MTFSMIFKYTCTRSKTQQNKYHLRIGKKKKITVTGKGIHKRSEKKPLHTPDEKAAFSQPQSFSLVPKGTNVPIFGITAS